MLTVLFALWQASCCIYKKKVVKKRMISPSFILFSLLLDEEEKEKDKKAARLAAGIDENEESVEEEDVEEEEYETISSRFVEKLLRHLLRGFKAKSVSVRLRCCQIIALSISSMGEIDENLYQDLRTSLFERIKDKDASVRIQAVTALCRLQGADKDVDPVDGKTILEKLMWSLQHDTSSELRRVILFNIDVNEETLPFIVERVRDIDPINRRVVYLKPLSEISDYKLLSLDDRHKILEWGLNDRDVLVQKGARKMLSAHWIRHANNNLIEFLESLEIMNRNVGEGVLNAFFNEPEFWKNLTPESAFLANVFIHFLQKNDTLDERLDTILPELTRHAFHLDYYNQLSRSDDDNATDYEYITSQMLDISMCLDYADEVGRRKMFELLREMLKVSEIPDAHLSRIVKVFRILSMDERDFTRTMIEIISDIQEQASSEGSEEVTSKRQKLDSQSDDDRSSTVSGDKFEGLVIKMRCLNICRCMLENSQESLLENSSLYGLLNDLIVPAVQSNEPILRETGLHCLGLCCSLDKTLAQHNVSLFLHCIKNGHESLQKLALMILFDLIMTYGIPTLCGVASNIDEIRELFEFTLDHDSSEIQRVATEGLTKLMLTKRFRDEEILRLLVLLYFFPTSSTDTGNHKIRQCLTYFFPAFCFSSSENQKSLINITIPALNELIDIYSDLDEGEEMVSPTQIAAMMADWVDPRKLARLHVKTLGDQKTDMGLPAQLAITALENIKSEIEVVKRKVMSQFLAKLYIDDASEEHLQQMMDILNELKEGETIKEALIRNTLLKVERSIEILLSNCRPLREATPATESVKAETPSESVSKDIEGNEATSTGTPE
ncbi:nuclear condensing complex subunit [Pilobolus umbonatus]|nr:nuclear condensing complex subunit [Pilobolus umbonatus]